MLLLVILVTLVLLLLGALPRWPYSHSWGYAPSGVVMLAVVAVLLLAVTGRV
ncbi:MAG: hypothetical protein JWO72_3131 [Caulobacteraceae bacterium]|jgi:hypothetical protein|nr:hypothetical protein [Caulobacteraceae bacterium]